MVDLSTMEWTAFQAQVVHHIEIYKKKKQKEEDDHNQLITQLQKAQLSEIMKQNKKDKEKAKTQAAIVVPIENPSEQGAALVPYGQ